MIYVLTVSFLCVWLLFSIEWYSMNIVQYFADIKQPNNKKGIA